jgi:hypothetical protein
MVSARSAIDGTDIIAQVAQTCYHPITETIFSITGYQKPASLHHSGATDYSPAVTLVLVPAVSPVLKTTPESRTFSDIIYDPHVWVEEVVFLLRF